MSQSYIQNTKDNSIYNYIKQVNKELYKTIKNSGAKHIFMKSNITFLMPNEVLLKKILTVSSKDALNILKQLLLVGTINNLSDFDQNIFNIYELKINNPSSLLIKVDPKWKYNKYCSVFLYDGDDVPVTSKESTTKQSKNNTKSIDYKLQKHKKVIRQYREYINNNKIGVNPFVMEIANILNIVKSDPKKYLEVCELLDNNAIVSWFIIIQLGLTDNQILSNDLFKLKTIDHPNPCDEYNKAFEKVNPTVNGQSWFKNVSNIRKKLVNYFDISLPDQILSAYDNNYTKLLQDEIRFKYRNLSEHYIENIINDLEFIDWSNPKKYIIFGNEELCKYLIQDEDKFYSGPVKFIKSIYFMYKPLNKKFYGQLIEKTKTSCADPYTNGIVYGDEGDRVFTSIINKESRRGYNIKSVWDSFNESEREQMRDFSHVSKST
jgi:hypothetical protein